MRHWKFAVIISGSLLLGVSQIAAQAQTNSPAIATHSLPSTVHALKAKGIENFYQLSERVYSGAAPEGQAAFAALAERGIRTIITVDGIQPDVEMAKLYGIRYVHLPIGYDGVPTNQAIRIVKAAETLPGPIFIHCHHGTHRGPAGAAVICMAMEGWTAAQADAWLHQAGTSTNYAGLYASVRQFQPPTAEALKRAGDDFPSRAKVSALADVMIQIDERFDTLKLIKKNGYESPAAPPDLDPAHEALLLQELLHELRRSGIVDKRNEDFKIKLDESTASAAALQKCLAATPVDPKAADAAFQKIADSCAACHKAHRN